MPGKIKVKVLAGRNLPVMDRAGDTTDAFVEIKFGGVTHKTDVCRKSLNPHWSSTEWYRFEVDESELQDEPLQLRLMDHDTYSANDAIGKVVISLAPLLAREANNVKGVAAPPGGAVLSGWIPVFDTMHGIRGELNVIVKVELFSDFNKYKTSSCGVQFFHCPMIPPGYRATAVHGFVEELVVNDDPEYQWIDKIRTPRASNEARQVAFIKLSNQVQRLVGLKAAELGANAVIGYQQDFDLEGEAGVVARAIGTAVSITPLPMPSQTISIPPCTQQQLRKYLDILATDAESITDLNQYFQHHQDELKNLLNILNPKTPALLDDPENVDEDEKSINLTRQSSIKSYAGNVSIYQDDYVSQNSMRHLSEDQTDLNKLLKRNDDSDSDSTGPLQTIKKIKTNFFKKRFGSVRSRKPEQSDKQEDQISLQSNSSDTSRISLNDIKIEFKKFKRIKKPKFRKGFANKLDEGIGMASILARSVIHAHTSLACIAETQDSEHSPCSTMRRTSESEPTINMPEDMARIVSTETGIDANDFGSKRNVPDIHTSLKNINTTETGDANAQRKLSESCPTSPMVSRSSNHLKLPEETGYFGSISLSGESSEVCTSSDEDDESSDQKTDTEKSVETTSSVVQSVLNNNGANSVFITQMDKKLCSLQVVTPEPSEITHQEVIDDDRQEFSSEESESSGSSSNVHENENNKNEKIEENTDKTTTQCSTLTPKQNSLHFKFHNPFSHKKVSKSISAPSSPIEKTGFVYRSSRKIKSQFSRLSKSNMIKSLSHYSLIPKKKHVDAKTTLSQPGSTTDVPSKAPSETVLGSPFLSYADLLSLDKETSGVHKKLYKSDEIGHSKVTMYIGSEPASRASLSGPSSIFHGKEEDHYYEHTAHRKPSIKPTGLVHTAMETILIDKVQSLLVPTSPEITQSKEQQFFDHVTEKLEKVEEDRIKYEDYKHIKTEFEDDIIRNDDHHYLKVGYLGKEKPKKHSLVHTAMETILMDKVQSLLIPTTPDTIETEEKLFYDVNKTRERVEETRSRQPENVDHGQSSFAYESSNPKHKREKDSLMQTAIKTVLIDKIQTLIPTSSEPITLHEQQVIEQKKQQAGHSEEIKNIAHNSLIHTAMETMLIDKMQSLLPPVPLDIIDSPLTKESDIVEKDKDRDSLFHSALETVLIDKVQSLLVPTTASQKYTDDDLLTIIRDDPQIEDEIKTKDRNERKLVKQDSIHSIDESNESRKMSKEIETNLIPCKKTKPVLQHFHPILGGAPLETIPSLPETSFDHSESLDVEGVERSSDVQAENQCLECDSETNHASACDNSHAACRFDRNEKEKEKCDKEKESPRHARHESYGGREPVLPVLQTQNSSLNSSSTPMGIHRRSSDSDLSVTPKGGSLNTSLGNAGSGGGAILRPSMNSNNLEMLEYPFLTMTEYPPGFIVHIGGTVCARSVKLVDAGGESAARAAWWAELRTELRAHARALRCNAVIAYTEGAAICEDVCVLSASGTAAVINLDCDFNSEIDTPISVAATNGTKPVAEEVETDTCSMAHVPYSPGTGPYRAELSNCGGCRRARVPAVLLATCAKPSKLPSYAKCVTVTAVAARIRRAPPASEPGARDISDQLPFLEYELHKLLLAKLRMQGANALFSLQTQIAIGERFVMALANGTAVRLAALPPPTPPRIKASETDKNALDIQRALWDSFTANKAANGYDIGTTELTAHSVLPEIESEEAPALDLCADKDACVLELDEAEDVETAKALAMRRMHMQVFNSSLNAQPAVAPHAFAQVWRARLTVSGQGGGASTAAERHVARALDGVTYKLRRLQPCALVAPRFQLELPEDEIQLVVSGAAIPLVDPNKPEELPLDNLSQNNGNSLDTEDTHSSSNQQGDSTGDADDDIFTLDEEQLVKQKEPVENCDDKNLFINGQTPMTVSLTSLSHVSGSRAARRVCALRLLFVRETTAVRELGGLSGFLHTFTCEVLAIVRAYTAALGGNVLTSFYITQLMLQDNAHKNQGQCLLSVGGDVVHIMY